MAITKRIWMRICPGCGNAIAKQTATDSWKCAKCGWS